jgi:hypothetical protein
MAGSALAPDVQQTRRPKSHKLPPSKSYREKHYELMNGSLPIYLDGILYANEPSDSSGAASRGQQTALVFKLKIAGSMAWRVRRTLVAGMFAQKCSADSGHVAASSEPPM